MKDLIEKAKMKKPSLPPKIRLNAIMQHKSVSINEVRDAFFSPKIKKRLGYEEINFNVSKKCFSEL